MMVLNFTCPRSVYAADIKAGERMVQDVCSHCHGIRKSFVLGGFPSLSGRDPRRI